LGEFHIYELRRFLEKCAKVMNLRGEIKCFAEYSPWFNAFYENTAVFILLYLKAGMHLAI
jgi:hypothetical protein